MINKRWSQEVDKGGWVKQDEDERWNSLFIHKDEDERWNSLFIHPVK